MNSEYPVTLKALSEFISYHCVHHASSRSAGAVYAISPSRFLARHQEWVHALPRVKPFYAVKCNPEPLLLNWLHDAGAGFDCASAREISLVSPHTEVLFANPCKKMEDLAAAIGTRGLHGKPTTVVDSVEEVEKLASVKWPGDALVRIAVEDKGSAMPFSSKFGAPVTTSAIGKIADAARAHKVPLTGFSFHVGSGCYSPKQYSSGILAALGLFPVLQSYKHTPTTIDIGGGFTSGPSFQEAAKVIRKTQNDLPPSVRLVAEPGRFYAASVQDLFTKVIGKKPCPSQKGWAYTIDESLYGQFSCIPFDYAKPKWLRVRDPKDKQRPFTAATLFGRTCDSLDMIAKAQTTEELEVGDWLWWPNMGAYTSVTATEFNGFPRPPVVTASTLPSLQEIERLLNEMGAQGCAYVQPVKLPQLA